MKNLRMFNMLRYKPNLTYKSNEKWFIWCGIWTTILSFLWFLTLSILMFAIDESSFGLIGTQKGYNLIHKHQDLYNKSIESDPLNNGWGIAFIFQIDYDPSYIYGEVTYIYRDGNVTSNTDERFNLTIWNSNNFPEEMLDNLRNYSNFTYCPNYSSENEYKFIGSSIANAK